MRKDSSFGSLGTGGTAVPSAEDTTQQAGCSCSNRLGLGLTGVEDVPVCLYPPCTLAQHLKGKLEGASVDCSRPAAAGRRVARHRNKGHVALAMEWVAGPERRAAA